jgi:hypothetical protein
MKERMKKLTYFNTHRLKVQMFLNTNTVKLGYNGPQVIANKFFSPMSMYNTLTTPGYNKRILPAPSCLL